MKYKEEKFYFQLQERGRLLGDELNDERRRDLTNVFIKSKGDNSA
jgi:hypothetical protein